MEIKIIANTNNYKNQSGLKFSYDMEFPLKLS